MSAKSALRGAALTGAAAGSDAHSDAADRCALAEADAGLAALTAAAEEYVRSLFAGDAGGHGADHSLRVLRNALEIAESVPGCDLELVSLAALLHDADDPKLFCTEDFANARSFMRKQYLPEEEIRAVCRIIDQVSFSKNRGLRPDSTEACIVQDADRLDAIGAVGIARTFAYGGSKGRDMEDSVRHFHEKLLLLKDMMNTEAARKLAEIRHEFMLAFLEELENETSQR